MKNKLNKNNVFDSLNSAFEQFTESPPDRVWDAVELDLAKKQLKKDKKRFFWIQFLSIGIVIFFALFGVYELANHTNSLSNNSSVNKKPSKIIDASKTQNKANEYIKLEEVSNTNKNSTKNENILANKNIKETATTTTQIKTNSGNKLLQNSTVITANNSNKKSVSEKKITENKINTSSSQLVKVNINKINSSGNNQKDTTQNNNSDVNKTNTLNQSSSKNTNSQNVETGKDSSANVATKNNLDGVTTQHPDSAAIVANTSKLDTINQINNTLAPIQPNKTPSRLSLMAFFSPDYSSRILMGGNAGSTASKYNKGESPLFAFKSGLKIGYDLSEKWNIQLGATYSYMEQKSTPTKLNIDSSETEHVQYSFSTSSGIVNFSSDDFKEDDAGSLSKSKVYSSFSAKEKIQFINVPVLIRYRFLNKKISVYFLGGFTANFIISKQVKLDVLNQPGSLTVNTNKISGLRKMNGGFLFGFECHYNLYKGLAVLLAPTVTGSFTSINKNTPVKSFPFSLGLGAGLIYHF